MPKFTVVLLRPEYIADSSTPADTYTAFVKAKDPLTAVTKAQHKAMHSDDAAVYDDAEDYYPIAVYRGHIRSLL